MPKPRFIPQNPNAIEQNINKEIESGREVRKLTSRPETNVTFQQVKLSQITPRLFNRYSQNRIEELAQSIRNTNNRLIHPITLVYVGDLPEDHPVIKEIEKQGKSISDYRYIIVSGERRFHAFQLLQKQEAENIKDDPNAVNVFDRITANILTPAEAQNEEVFYRDSNNLARQLTAAEGVWFIKDLLNGLDSNAKKREILVKMNGGSEEGIPQDPDKAARKFKVVPYVQWSLQRNYGICEWSQKYINNIKPVAEKCCGFVLDKCISGEYNVKEAKRITNFSSDLQIELVNMFIKNRLEYEQRLTALKTSVADKDSLKVTHKQLGSTLASNLSNLKKERKRFETQLEKLGTKPNQLEKDAVKLYDDFIEKFSKLIEEAK